MFNHAFDFFHFFQRWIINKSENFRGQFCVIDSLTFVALRKWMLFLYDCFLVNRNFQKSLKYGSVASSISQLPMSKSREAKTGSLVGREQAQLCGQMPLRLEWNLFISSRTEWGRRGGGRIVKDCLRMCKQMKPSLPQKRRYRPALHTYQRLPSLSWKTRKNSVCSSGYEIQP